MKYTDGNTYFYVRNVQGDIIKIVNSSGTVVVEYAYDAWGNPMGITGTMAATLGAENPFRYRGYYYDTETGLYYLQSRYYNPEWGRFVNADSLGGKIGVLLSHNIFVYCSNNPVNFVDPSGYLLVVDEDYKTGEIIVASPNGHTFTLRNGHTSITQNPDNFSYVDHSTYNQQIDNLNRYRMAVGPLAALDEINGIVNWMGGAAEATLNGALSSGVEAGCEALVPLGAAAWLGPIAPAAWTGYTLAVIGGAIWGGLEAFYNYCTGYDK